MQHEVDSNLSIDDDLTPANDRSAHPLLHGVHDVGPSWVHRHSSVQVHLRNTTDKIFVGTSRHEGKVFREYFQQRNVLVVQRNVLVETEPSSNITGFLGSQSTTDCRALKGPAHLKNVSAQVSNSADNVATSSAVMAA